MVLDPTWTPERSYSHADRLINIPRLEEEARRRAAAESTEELERALATLPPQAAHQRRAIRAELARRP